jgi:hypothetical protein
MRGGRGDKYIPVGGCVALPTPILRPVPPYLRNIYAHICLIIRLLCVFTSTERTIYIGLYGGGVVIQSRYSKKAPALWRLLAIGAIKQLTPFYLYAGFRLCLLWLCCLWCVSVCVLWLYGCRGCAGVSGWLLWCAVFICLVCLWCVCYAVSVCLVSVWLLYLV